MWDADEQAERGLDLLRRAVALLVGPGPGVATTAIAGPATAVAGSPTSSLGLAMTATPTESGSARTVDGVGGEGGGAHGDGALAASSEDSAEERGRLIALVELARDGDVEAFGALYDHYQAQVYRFLVHRTRSVHVAEDLSSETFFRALRRMGDFRWQGKDFGAWLMTIARNLVADHYKAGRTRLELPTEDMSRHDLTADGPESEVLSALTHEILLDALTTLPSEQRDCLVMRFLQGMSIAETAAVLGRSDGAVKQLQLRGVRNLAKRVPAEVRDP